MDEPILPAQEVNQKTCMIRSKLPSGAATYNNRKVYYILYKGYQEQIYS